MLNEDFCRLILEKWFQMILEKNLAYSRKKTNKFLVWYCFTHRLRRGSVKIHFWLKLIFLSWKMISNDLEKKPVMLQEKTNEVSEVMNCSTWILKFPQFELNFSMCVFIYVSKIKMFSRTRHMFFAPRIISVPHMFGVEVFIT